MRNKLILVILSARKQTCKIIIEWWSMSSQKEVGHDINCCHQPQTSWLRKYQSNGIFYVNSTFFHCHHQSASSKLSWCVTWQQKNLYLSWLSFNKWNTSPHLTYQRLQYICWSLCLKSVLLFFARKYSWPESRLLDECSSNNAFLPQLNNSFQHTKTGIKKHRTGMK